MLHDHTQIHAPACLGPADFRAHGHHHAANLAHGSFADLMQAMLVTWSEGDPDSNNLVEELSNTLTLKAALAGLKKTAG